MIGQRSIDIVGSLPSAASVSSSMICDDIHSCRTVSNIVFTCASTMFLCTWVVLHPSIPKNPRGAAWKRLLKRLGYMFLALLAPEAILYKALLDWIESCERLKALLNKYPDCGWTETQAMFAYMGGFRLASKGSAERIQLKGEAFFEKAMEREIEIPTISDAEIMDRSKGDDIAKMITIIQTLWFALQAAHRISQDLIVTEIELTTLGHVVLAIFIYWCWWYKPLNIRFPVDIYSKEGERREEPPMEEKKAETGEVGGEPKSLTTIQQLDVSSRGDDQREGQPAGGGEEVQGGYKEPESQTAAIGGGVVQTDPEIAREPESQLAVRRPLPFRVRIGAAIRDDNSPFIYDTAMTILFVTVAGMFGAIHCLAWNSTFATHTESIIWRVASVIVTAVPGVTISIDILMPKNEEGSWWIFAPLFFFFFVYCIARICLLVIALIALRSLPYRAYVSPSWGMYIPHIA